MREYKKGHWWFCGVCGLDYPARALANDCCVT